MVILLILISLAFITFLTWCLLLQPRGKQPGWEKLSGVRYMWHTMPTAASTIR